MVFSRLQHPTQRALLVAVALGAVCAAAWAQDKKPVPDAAAQARAQELIREVYGKEYDAAKTSAEKMELARKLLEQAAKSKEDPGSHFVLLRIGKEMAVLAGDPERALDAVNRIVETYDVDPLEEKLACLRALAGAAKLPSQHGAIAQQAFSLLDVAMSEDEFEAAHQLAKIARESATRARDYTLLKQIVARMKGVEEIEKAHAEYQKFVARLEEFPTDPEANLACGRYLCLAKGDWERGIPMLALGSDPVLKDLAVRELKGAASPDARIALGDAWWDLAETKEGHERESFLLRAGHWYEQAQPKATSPLMKVKLQQRLEEIAKIERRAAHVAAAAARPGRRRAGPEPVRRFDPASAELLATLRGHTRAVRSVAFSPDGKTLVSGSMDHTVTLWNVATREPRGVLPPFKHGELDVALSPDGSLLAVAGREFTASVWNAASGQFRGLLTGHTRGVFCIAFSPDRSLLATGSDDNTVMLWDVATGRLRGRIVGHGNKVYAVAFSPDGSLLASGAHDQPVRLWDVATGTLRRTLAGSETRVFSVAFSPNGSILASGGSDKTVRLWNPATGDLLRTLEGHESDVNGVAFSPDGSLLASGSHDKTAKLWDVASGALRRTLEGHVGYVWSVAFSPDGSLLASASEDCTIKLWGPGPGRRVPKTEPETSLPPGRMPMPKGKVATPGLTPDEEGWILLPPLVEATRDTEDAGWRWDGQTAAFSAGRSRACVSFPVSVIGSYDLQARITITKAKETTAICLPIVGTKAVVLEMKGDRGSSESPTATIRLKGLNPAPQPQGNVSMNIGTEYAFSCRVIVAQTGVGVEILRDDQVLFQWLGDVSQVEERRTMRPATVELGTNYYTSSRFKDLRLRMLAGQATPLFSE